MGDKKKIFIIIISILLIILINYLSYINKEELTNDTKDNDWISKNVELIKDKSLGKNIYKVYKNSDISIFNLKYQKIISRKINDLSKEMQEDFLIIYNPYGTNPLSINILLKDTNYQEITYEISSKKASDFSKKIALKSDKNSYQLVGLLPGESNKIKLTITGKSKSKIYDFTVDLSDIEINSAKEIEIEKSANEKPLAEGLYAILGNASDYQNYIALYDNEGIIRSELPLKEAVSNELVFNNNDLFYNVSSTEIVRLNNIGEITNIYKTGNYRIEGIYQFYNNDLYVLASNITKNTLKSCLLKINIENNEIEEVLSLDNLFKDYIPICQKEDNEKLNYLDINSFKIIDNNLYLSSKETSSLFKISNFLEEPKIDYIISNDIFWKNTPFSDLVFQKKGDFKFHAGQDSLTIAKDDEENIYYFSFFNSNYGNSLTRKDFNYDDINIKNSNLYQGDNSYYYVYRIDELNKTFELVDSLSLDYSGIGGSIQKLENSNILINVSTRGEFFEYDKDLQLLRKYKVNINKNFISKVEKYTFKDYWFN